MFDYILDWGHLKDWLADELHVSHAVLHIHIGLLLFLLLMLVLKRRPVVALLLLACIEGANEAVDFGRYYFSHWPWTPWPTIEDIVNTLLWPTILTIALLVHRRRAAAVIAAG